MQPVFFNCCLNDATIFCISAIVVVPNILTNSLVGTTTPKLASRKGLPPSSVVWMKWPRGLLCHLGGIK